MLDGTKWDGKKIITFCNVSPSFFRSVISHRGLFYRFFFASSAPSIFGICLVSWVHCATLQTNIHFYRCHCNFSKIFIASWLPPSVPSIHFAHSIFRSFANDAFHSKMFSSLLLTYLPSTRNRFSRFLLKQLFFDADKIDKTYNAKVVRS